MNCHPQKMLAAHQMLDSLPILHYSPQSEMIVGPGCRRRTSSSENAANHRSQRIISRTFPKRIRPSTLFALLLIAVSALLPAAQCATFFYGATEDSDAVERTAQNEHGQLEMETMPTADEHNLVLAEGEEEYDETRLSQQELESVYKFCSLLPMLEEAGHVIKNKQARQVCDKLVAMLKPMFRKRTKAIRPRRAVMMMQKRRRW